MTTKPPMIALESLAACFQGLIPGTLHTCSADGEPNVTYLSQVDYVDARHVALSFQFFNKSRRNIDENPYAMVRVHDPDTMQGYDLRLRYERSETEGPLFDAMELRIEAIASYSGLKGIFKLRAADVYEVLGVERVADDAGIDRPAVEELATPFTLAAMQEMSSRMQRTQGLEELLDSVLGAMGELFGFMHSMILLSGEGAGTLTTIASHGYPEQGVGSEVGIGEGIIGMVAEARAPVRVSGMVAEMLYASAVRERAVERGLRPEESREIPLPGLARPDSQLALPLVVRGELLGVLCIESESPYRFHEDDRTYLDLLGVFIAIAMQNALLRERTEEPGEARGGAGAVGTGGRAGGRGGRRGAALPRREVVYYAGDECVLVDGAYLVRGLAARILWKLLDEHAATGRTEFSNRELRLDKSLCLPDFKDNLETRLILLRRRLAERCPEIRLARSGRGRFTLELGCELKLTRRD